MLGGELNVLEEGRRIWEDRRTMRFLDLKE